MDCLCFTCGPKFIGYAVPGNWPCGVCPIDSAEQMQAYCGQMTDSAG